MKTYLLLITEQDGTQAQAFGIYSDGFAALIDLMDVFPTARRLSARRLP